MCVIGEMIKTQTSIKVNTIFFVHNLPFHQNNSTSTFKLLFLTRILLQNQTLSDYTMNCDIKVHIK